MARLLNINAKACCSLEKKKLVRALRTCDYYSTSKEEQQKCYREAAKDSGRRSKECILLQ